MKISPSNLLRDTGQPRSVESETLFTISRDELVQKDDIVFALNYATHVTFGREKRT